MYFAQGYIHAQHRLWQMDLHRRVGRGTLAEVGGVDLVDIDAAMRALDLQAIASRHFWDLSPRARLAIVEYANGVNTFINTTDSLPVEFEVTGTLAPSSAPRPLRSRCRLLAGPLAAGGFAGVGPNHGAGSDGKSRSRAATSARVCAHTRPASCLRAGPAVRRGTVCGWCTCV